MVGGRGGDGVGGGGGAGGGGSGGGGGGGNGVPRRGAVAITGRRLRGRPARWVATAHAPRAVARPRPRPARAAARWEAVGG